MFASQNTEYQKIKFRIVLEKWKSNFRSQKVFIVLAIK